MKILKYRQSFPSESSLRKRGISRFSESFDFRCQVSAAFSIFLPICSRKLVAICVEGELSPQDRHSARLLFKVSPKEKQRSETFLSLILPIGKIETFAWQKSFTAFRSVTCFSYLSYQSSFAPSSMIGTNFTNTS